MRLERSSETAHVAGGAVIHAPVSRPAQRLHHNPDALMHDAPPPLELGLPRGLYAVLAGTFGVYMLVMAVVFGAGAGMGLIFAVFGVTLAAFFGLPWVMARASKPGPAAAVPHIDTASGILGKWAAIIQVMTLPVLILAWAVFIAFIVPR